MGKKKAYPNYDVEYTFKGKKEDKKTGQLRNIQYTLILEEVMSNGRLRFYNKTYGTYTEPMHPERFSFLHRFNLVSEKAIEVNPVTPAKQTAPKNIIKTDNHGEPITYEEFLQEIIDKLSGLPENKKHRIRLVKNKPVDVIINSLKWEQKNPMQGCDGIVALACDSLELVGASCV